MLYQSNWIKSGILYVKDLHFANGKVDETFIVEKIKPAHRNLKNKSSSKFAHRCFTANTIKY